MNFVLFYLFSFILTQVGFLLGKSTKEEHKEIKGFVSHIIEILVFFVYVFAFYFLVFVGKFSLFGLYLALFSFFLYCFRTKSKLLYEHNVLFFGLLFNTFYGSVYVFLVLFLIFAMVMESSFREFNFKIFLLEFILLCVIAIVFSLLGFVF